ncbi:MAG: SCP2 sterol-binding domain-containing protein [Euzebya sp.]
MSKLDFPSIEWMQAYADLVAAHPTAADLGRSLQGRYRFVITADGALPESHAYDLVVDPEPAFRAVRAEDEPADLVVTAGYGRWQGLLSGKSDFVMSYLMRRIKIDGDISEIRGRLRDARPLLDCLKEVPTRYVY